MDGWWIGAVCVAFLGELLRRALTREKDLEKRLWREMQRNSHLSDELTNTYHTILAADLALRSSNVPATRFHGTAVWAEVRRRVGLQGEQR